jgi:hypothetical protein
MNKAQEQCLEGHNFYLAMLKILPQLKAKIQDTGEALDRRILVCETWGMILYQTEIAGADAKYVGSSIHSKLLSQ